ncbi:hypothetical protein [Clostridium butyricum]|uniref:Uncharacterized protein n=1 Tax=Clostridium butyricum E4 str. BoNT E BL5262 TaxID=632245 RepID=C4IKR1_CLOBU|nr:hypothetical protein [Clostridium butyricum]APF21851.1 putative membrane protein [Clostridium butyricum]EDT75137.1 hypothetical protein CBY_3284 [Clostridium butyricum 5521]EEP54791.1 conserved hypothetical protein [Clostridium butyricum E4 str. BoNT E BL5262]NFL32913.1 hypothetical protein [Clostridium butyricum]NFS20271.1 hypothetical protein [Clostridium butyricum]
MEILNKILEPKWLIVAIMLVCMGYLTFAGKIGTEAFISIISVIVGYYFGASAKDKERTTKDKDNKEDN